MIDEDEVDLSVVSVGVKVLVYDMEFDEEIDFAIVGSTEADPLANKISNESPMGKALIGARENEIVEFSTPNGTVKVRVLKIHQ